MMKLLSPTNRRISVASAGTMQVGGRASPLEAIEAAHRCGIDLSAHRSRYADDQMLNAADVVFVFDDANAEALRARVPGSKLTVIRLGLLADGDASWDISDPYGGDPAVYDLTFARIEQAVRAVHGFVAEAL